MLVEFGNSHAIEGFRDPDGADPEAVLYRRLPGDRVTTMVLPDDTSIQEAFATVTGALTLHMDHSDPLNKPAWIEASSPGLTSLLLEHYGIPEVKNVRPPTWGQEDFATKPVAAPKKKTTRRRSASATSED